MVIDSNIRNQFDENQIDLRTLKQEVDGILIAFCSKNNFAYSSRIKTIESVLQKIETARYQSWSELDDLFATTIIIPSLKEESIVVDYINKAFIVESSKRRGDSKKDHDVFRFDSSRFYVKISDKSKFIFEIQIRSAFEHAWSVATHDISYKSSGIDWKIQRLASQLKASVEQLDMIVLSAQANCSAITEFTWPRYKLLQMIDTFFQNMFNEEVIPIECKPKDMKRFIEVIYDLMKDSLRRSDGENEKELEKILNNIRLELNTICINGYPYSLSPYQVMYGILCRHGVVTKKKMMRTPIMETEMFKVIFNDIKHNNQLWFKVS